MRESLRCGHRLRVAAAIAVLSGQVVVAAPASAEPPARFMRVSVNAAPPEAGLIDLAPAGAGPLDSLTAAERRPASPSPADLVSLEARVLRLTEDLRCLVCQNQSIADSHADLAMDLKQQVREKILQGWTDAEVMDYMVQRYGDFVLYRPPVKRSTWLLWFGPLVLLLAGLAALVLRLRRLHEAAPALSDDELARAQALLQAGGGAGRGDFT